MKAVIISPAAVAELTTILWHWIDRWGLTRAKHYQEVLLERIRVVSSLTRSLVTPYWMAGPPPPVFAIVR